MKKELERRQRLVQVIEKSMQLMENELGFEEDSGEDSSTDSSSS